MSIKINNNEANFLVRLADTSTILGQRLSEMCSNGPTLEEDIALSNLALDLIGRAELLLKAVSEIEGGEYSADDYCYRRNEREYFNLKLVEQPNEDFAWVIARQYMHDVYVMEVFTQLLESNNSNTKAIAEKVIKEIRYSLEHSKNWMLRLGIGTEEANNRLQTAVDQLWKYMQEVFNFDEIDKMYLNDTDSIRANWYQTVEALLKEANLNVPETVAHHYLDYRQGFHSEYLGHLLSEMQFLPRAYPDAEWH
ncbi:MAG: 1,2-phenylacetyl-CoA epoxidase subunit PaaC [Putridiphycobacter sp.]